MVKSEKQLAYMTSNEIPGPHRPSVICVGPREMALECPIRIPPVFPPRLPSSILVSLCCTSEE